MRANESIYRYSKRLTVEKYGRKRRRIFAKYSLPDTYVQIIDSGGTDDTVQIAKNGFNVVTINTKDFNHGKTRNDIVNLNKK